VLVHFWSINIVKSEERATWGFALSMCTYTLIMPIVQVSIPYVPHDWAQWTKLQAFFNFRVYIMSRKIWLAMPGWILSVLHPLFAIASAVIFWKTESLGFIDTHSWGIFLPASLAFTVSS
jgi:uncharacterized membrane protein